VTLTGFHPVAHGDTETLGGAIYASSAHGVSHGKPHLRLPSPAPSDPENSLCQRVWSEGESLFLPISQLGLRFAARRAWLRSLGSFWEQHAGRR
jgi:hypothetical protein